MRNCWLCSWNSWPRYFNEDSGFWVQNAACNLKTFRTTYLNRLVVCDTYTNVKDIATTQRAVFSHTCFHCLLSTYKTKLYYFHLVHSVFSVFFFSPAYNFYLQRYPRHLSIEDLKRSEVNVSKCYSAASI